MIPEAICRLVAEVAPELEGLYVVFGSRMYSSLARAEEYLGVTAPNMDVRLREFIHPWRGRQPCMVLNDRLLQAEAEQLAGPDWPLAEVERWAFGSVALHEAAHILEERPPYYGGFCPAGPYPAEILEAQAAMLAVPEREIVWLKDRDPWHGHGPQWLRIVCHLSHRARKAGLNVSPSAIVDGHYGLSHPARYAMLLGDEPHRGEGRPFHEIISEPAPAGFQALWLDDTEGPDEEQTHEQLV